MRLTTWNVNGIRNPFSYPPWNTARTFPAMFDTLESDIIVMQELKIQRKDLRDDMILLDGWDCYFSLPKHKKGYSGVGIYTRNSTCSPIRAEEGLLGVLPSPSGVPYCELPEDESIGGYPSALQVAELGVDPAVLDAEGRCLVLEFPTLVLFGVYSPANSNGMRDDFRYGFICALDCRIRNLIRGGKRVVLVGDLNVSRDEQDTASAVEDMRKAGISHEDYISTPNRRIFNQLLVGGEVVGERDKGRETGALWDTTRGFHLGRKGMYTHWEQKINARPGNYGSRIDFVLVCEEMQEWIEDANTQEGLLGSDHCPVFADFKDLVTIYGNEVNLLDIMSPAGTFENGKRKREWRLQDIPTFSGKRLPEFDKRRSIKSMFAAPSLVKTQSSAITAPPEVTPVVAAQPEAHSSTPGEQATTSNGGSGKLETSAYTSPSLKRKTSAPAKTKPVKKQKTRAEPPAGKGQQSLKGFFQKSVQANSPSKPDTVKDVRLAQPPFDPSITLVTPVSVDQLSTLHDAKPNGATTALPSADADDAEPELPETPAGSFSSPTSDTMTSPSSFSAKLEAVEQNQKSWNALFSRPVAPLCEGHSEPCKIMLTKKKGSNQGRSFWMCARPLGPSGQKEKGTQWRCATFIWCSDWTGRKEEGKAVDPG